MKLVCGRDFDPEKAKTWCDNLHCTDMGKCMAIVEDSLFAALEEKKSINAIREARREEIRKQMIAIA